MFREAVVDRLKLLLKYSPGGLSKRKFQCRSEFDSSAVNVAKMVWAIELRRAIRLVLKYMWILNVFFVNFFSSIDWKIGKIFHSPGWDWNQGIPISRAGILIVQSVLSALRSVCARTCELLRMTAWVVCMYVATAGSVCRSKSVGLSTAELI
jgi:hypothetical protein